MGERTEDGALADATLIEVNDAMIALHERYHGRTPITARTTMLGDDLLACLLATSTRTSRRR